MHTYNNNTKTVSIAFITGLGVCMISISGFVRWFPANHTRFPLLNLPLPSILPALLKLMCVCVSKQFIVKQVHKLGFYRSRRIIVFRYPHFGGVAQTAAALEKKLTIWKMPNFRIQIISATYRFYYSHTHQPNANKNKHSPFFASACVKIAHKNHSFIWIFCYICAFFLFSLMEQEKNAVALRKLLE